MRVSSTVKGLSKVIQSLKKFEAEALESQVTAVRESTLLIHGNAVKQLQDNTDGTPQVRYSPKRTVAVSKPGTPPNTDKGLAVRSIKFDFQKGGLIGRVGTNLKYLARFELSGDDKVRRPWLSIAVSEASKEVAKIFSDAIKKVVKESAK